jgi:hypothetical protein
MLGEFNRADRGNAVNQIGGSCQFLWARSDKRGNSGGLRTGSAGKEGNLATVVRNVPENLPGRQSWPRLWQAPRGASFGGSFGKASLRVALESKRLSSSKGQNRRKAVTQSRGPLTGWDRHLVGRSMVARLPKGWAGEEPVRFRGRFAGYAEACLAFSHARCRTLPPRLDQSSMPKLFVVTRFYGVNACPGRGTTNAMLVVT